MIRRGIEVGCTCICGIFAIDINASGRISGIVPDNSNLFGITAGSGRNNTRVIIVRTKLDGIVAASAVASIYGAGI